MPWVFKLSMTVLIFVQTLSGDSARFLWLRFPPMVKRKVNDDVPIALELVLKTDEYQKTFPIYCCLFPPSATIHSMVSHWVDRPPNVLASDWSTSQLVRRDTPHANVSVGLTTIVREFVKTCKPRDGYHQVQLEIVKSVPILSPQSVTQRSPSQSDLGWLQKVRISARYTDVVSAGTSTMGTQWNIT